jgi:hypothetical protein
MHGRNEKYIKYFGHKPQERDYLGDIGIGGRRMLKGS